jgi:tripartite-type tricarboxylate transporter receptor subunit TctC
MKHLIRVVALAAAVAASGPVANAQVYPSRPITMNVPYAAGGPLDVMGRIVAEGMGERSARPS